MSSDLCERPKAVPYKQLACDPFSQRLFENRITTLDSLKIAVESGVSFLAVDTEHVALESEDDRLLNQVGLAYIPAITQYDPFPDRPRFDEFYSKNQVRGLTLNITPSARAREDLIRLHGKLPTRHPHRFGRELHVDLEDLEATVIEFVQSCNPKEKLVLIGFELAAEWTYMFRVFPKLIPYISAWADMRNIAKDIAPFADTPGRVCMLQICGYHWHAVKGSMVGGTSDNAGDDTVTTLAMAKAFLYPEIREKFIYRQKCLRIAQSYSTRKGPKHLGANQIAFGATVESNDKGPLPTSLDSGMKLARYFFDSTPVSAGVWSPELAVMIFSDRDQLSRFIRANDGRTLDTGETLSVLSISDGSRINLDYGDISRTEKLQKVRAEKKAEKEEEAQELEGEPLGLGDMFLEDDPKSSQKIG